MSDIERDAPSLVIIFLILILVVGAGFVGYSLGERHQIEKEKELGKCLQEFKSLDKCVKLTGVKIKSVNKAVTEQVQEIRRYMNESMEVIGCN